MPNKLLSWPELFHGGFSRRNPKRLFCSWSSGYVGAALQGGLAGLKPASTKQGEDGMLAGAVREWRGFLDVRMSGNNAR